MTKPAEASRSHGGHADDARLVDLVRQLGAVLAELGLSELEVSRGDVKVRVQRTTPGASALATSVTGGPERGAMHVVDLPDGASSALVTVEAPMVGTFYRASSPTAEPYVREGDVVKHGQILCIIEAMKLMNEIESKVSGRVAKILAENGQPVEYGQPLFVIDPR